MKRQGTKPSVLQRRASTGAVTSGQLTSATSAKATAAKALPERTPPPPISAVRPRNLSGTPVLGASDADSDLISDRPLDLRSRNLSDSPILDPEMNRASHRALSSSPINVPSARTLSHSPLLASPILKASSSNGGRNGASHEEPGWLSNDASDHDFLLDDDDVGTLASTTASLSKVSLGQSSIDASKNGGRLRVQNAPLLSEQINARISLHRASNENASYLAPPIVKAKPSTFRGSQ